MTAEHAGPPIAQARPSLTKAPARARYVRYGGPHAGDSRTAGQHSRRRASQELATTERQRLEFRLEAQNARNHPIFSDPPASYGASNFGLINGTKVGARTVQLGFKYYF